MITRIKILVTRSEDFLYFFLVLVYLECFELDSTQVAICKLYGKMHEHNRNIKKTNQLKKQKKPQKTVLCKGFGHSHEEIP